MSKTGGPLPKSVYVRRRIFVLVGLLAFIAAVLLIVWRPGIGDDRIRTNEVAVPDDLVTVEEQQAADELGPDELPVCASGRLTVTPLTSASSYGPEDDPLLSLRIENTSEEECVAELGTAHLIFEITSGSDQIWRSTDCQVEADYRAIVLLPGEPEETEAISWNRERSSPETCDLPREKVGANGASYHLRVSAAGVASQGSAQFQLY